MDLVLTAPVLVLLSNFYIPRLQEVNSIKSAEGGTWIVATAI